MANIDRRADQLAIKFYEDTPLGPERLVKLIGKRRDMRLDPAGTLWLDWKRTKETNPMEAAKKVLMQLQA